MSGYGRRYCACGKEFKAHFASTTKCPDCSGSNGENEIKSRDLVKMLMCRRCIKVRRHTFAGSYGGVRFYKCECGLWRRE